MQPAEEAVKLYEQAQVYDGAGDVYNAIKLYKKVIKREADWPAPYFRLLAIYKRRQEWKQAFHYAKRSLALDPSQPGIWWDLGIAATALKKWRIAANVWSKFDMPTAFPDDHRTVFSLPLQHGKQMELIWVRPLCPARAEIISIPLPDTQRHYRDLVLYDRRQLMGHNITDNRKLPIYEYLGHWKHSSYRTFSCRLYAAEEKEVQILASLCHDAGFGFENWSNSALNAVPKKREKKSEFYNMRGADGVPPDVQWIAIAAHNQREVERLLRQWQLISLREYDALQQHT